MHPDPQDVSPYDPPEPERWLSQARPGLDDGAFDPDTSHSIETHLGGQGPFLPMPQPRYADHVRPEPRPVERVVAPPRQVRPTLSERERMQDIAFVLTVIGLAFTALLLLAFGVDLSATP